MNITIKHIGQRLWRVEASTEQDDWGCTQGSFAQGSDPKVLVVSVLENLGQFDKPVPGEQPRLGLSKHVAIDAAGIRLALDDAIASGAIVALDYTDKDGKKTSRNVKPLRISTEPEGGWFEPVAAKYVIAKDVGKDAVRSFRLDRIDRVEFA